MQELFAGVDCGLCTTEGETGSTGSVFASGTHAALPEVSKCIVVPAGHDALYCSSAPDEPDGKASPLSAITKPKPIIDKEVLSVFMVCSLLYR